jgi:transposase
VACPEDNLLENLWRALKGEVAANRSYGSIEELTRRARLWLEGLTPQEALRTSWALSKSFWLAA